MHGKSIQCHGKEKLRIPKNGQAYPRNSLALLFYLNATATRRNDNHSIGYAYLCPAQHRPGKARICLSLHSAYKTTHQKGATMKAHIHPRNAVTNRVYTAALKIASDQADDIAARTANEIAVAMYGCRLSPKTIEKVMTYYNEVIGPRWKSYRDTGDGDSAMLTFCSDHGLPYLTCHQGKC